MTDTPETTYRDSLSRRRWRLIPIGIAAFCVFGLLVYLMMWLWNTLMPQLFHLGHIGYWQALGVFILARLLFGGFGIMGRRSHRRPAVIGWRSAPPTDAYQAWWEAEGRASFEQYLKR